MKRKGFRIVVLCMVAAMLLGGCGDELYELTDSEQAAIVGYSSHVVSKFNKKQSEGITDVAAYKAALALEEEEKKKAAEEKKKQEEEKKQEQSTSQSTENGTTSSQSSTTQSKNYVSLNQALQLGGVEAIYKSYRVAESYKETESYMVTANSGNELLIVRVDLKNSGKKKVSCDVLSKMPTFRVTVNGSDSAGADTTILLNDLSTYQASIQAGETKKTVLLFQFPKGTVKKVSSMDLDVTIGDSTSTVQLVSK